MKFTIWLKPYRLALACLVVATTGAVSNSAVATSWRQTAIKATKNAFLKLPCTTQKNIAVALHSYPAFKTDATEWRLKLLVDDFMDTNNMRPLSYYIDEFMEIINADPEYFQSLLFKHALRADTPNQDAVMQTILDGLKQTKHSKNIAFIKAMLYLPIRKWVRKDGKIPTDALAEKALVYHASFNKG